MNIRIAVPADVTGIMEIIADAKALLRERGIDQWQKGYPNEAQIRADIAQHCFYVLEDGSPARIAAIAAVIVGVEPSYARMEGGDWLTPPGARYATVHRMAVRSGCYGKGYPLALFARAEEIARMSGCISLRADTHPENLAMRRTLQKAGFTPLGTIYLSGSSEDGDVRIAMEKLL